MVVGLQALTRAVAEIERLSRPGAYAWDRRELRRGDANRRSECEPGIGCAAHQRHDLAADDRSDTGAG